MVRMGRTGTKERITPTRGTFVGRIAATPAWGDGQIGAGMDELLSRIEDKIEGVASFYRRVPGAILTEDDLKCFLFSRLLEVDELRTPRPTLSPGVLGTMVHTEVSWLDEDGRLSKKPDITILHPKDLSIFQDPRESNIFDRGQPRIALSKGFRFSGKAIIFEVKFIRGKRGVIQPHLKAVRKDLQKVTGLFDQLARIGAEDELFCYFVIFSRVDRLAAGFAELKREIEQHPRCRVIFGTAGVTWPAKRQGVRIARDRRGATAGSPPSPA